LIQDTNELGKGGVCTVTRTWAAGYDTWLLLKLTPKGTVFSVLFFSYRDERVSGCEEVGGAHGMPQHVANGAVAAGAHHHCQHFIIRILIIPKLYTIKRSINQSVNQSINQSINQSTNQPTCV